MYDKIDITVVPAALGLTGVQQSCHATPIVTDDDRYAQMPEWEAVIEGVTGSLVYRRDDIDSLAGAIRYWYGRISDAPDRVA